MAAEKPRPDALKRDSGPARLAAGLEKSLSAYASAAAAAGVSLLALTPAANAKIVYTPADMPIPVNEYFPLDLNHDGIGDFSIRNVRNLSGYLYLSVGCALHSTFRGAPPKSFVCNYLTDQIWGRGVVSGRFASALPAGFKVRGNKSYFQAAKYPFAAMMFEPIGVPYGTATTSRAYSSQSIGQWRYAKNRYLGFQFVIKGQVHYGWARLSVSLTEPSVRELGIYAVLTGYAYEDVPNKPIITGKIKGPDVVTLEPATLGHLAGGASQIPAWRVARNRFGTLAGSRSKAGPSSQAAP